MIAQITSCLTFPPISKAIQAMVEEINTAFAHNKTEGFLAHCADTIDWTMVGHRSVNGKDQVRAFIAEMEGPEPPQFSVERLLAAENWAVCYGEMSMKEDGKDAPYSFCDVYEFEGNLVARLTTFIVKHLPDGETKEASA
ncbi:hypothetical protein BH24ACI3_BH24ACI3_15170 [soil metagenome]